jgi:outer membrane protein assembly factor BamA
MRRMLRLVVLLCVTTVTASAVAAQTPAPGPQADAEIIAEVRVHGNYATPDAEVMRLAGITIGQPLGPDTLAQITKRLHDSGRFRQADIRKRYRSLSDTQHVVLILLVQERPSAGATGNPLLKPFRRMQEQFQFLPIINYADGYGFTYGARASFADALGKDGRVSVPLTWGANRRAAIELDKTFGGGLVSRVEGGASVSVRENPHFREDDGRRQVWGRAERDLVRGLKLGGELGVTHVNFEPFHDTFATYGADLTLDTRRDAIFPRDAIFASVGWDALNFKGGASTVNRYHTDVRGYVGLVGQSVLSLHARFDNAAGPLPPYEQALLGGSSSVRGFRTGAFAGDNRAVTSAELRIPLSSPLGISRAGVSLFVDSGAVYNDGERLRDATFHQGAGAGVFLLSPFLQINVDVAYGFGNRLRVHFTSGFHF